MSTFTRESAERRILQLVLFAFGFALCHFYGKFAFMPLDNSVAFDGGWRILSGQVPFKDFDLPGGLVVIYLQAFFFKVFGVSFSSYLFHSSLFNGAFAVMVFSILRKSGLSPWFSAFYGASSAVLFYPAMGWPSWDHHSFFFLAAAAFFLFFNQTESGYRAFAGLCCLVLAFLSKQIPAVLGILSFLVLYVFAEKEAIQPRLNALLIGGILLACAGGAITLALHVDPHRAFYDLWVLPSSVGSERIEDFDFSVFVQLVVRPFKGDYTQFNLLSYFCFLVVLGHLLVFHFRKLKSAREHIFLAFACYAICALYMLLTSNQNEIGMALVFLALGLMNQAVFIIYEKKVAAAISVLFLLITILDVIRFDRLVNQTRIVADVEGFTISQLREIEGTPKSMQPLRWVTPPEFNVSGSQIVRLIEKLKSSPDNFLLFGDFSALYGLTAKPSVFPALLFHEGLSIPRRKSAEFASFENRIMENIEKYNVKTILLEGSETYMRSNVDEFPRLAELISKYGCSYERLGFYRIVTLCR